jgi:hypothetical protein
VAETLNAVPIWAFDVWRTHIDEVCAVGWWIAFATILIKAATPRARTLRDIAFVLVPFACAAVIYVITPFAVGTAAYLNVRLAPLLVLFALLWLRPRNGTWGTVPLALAGTFTLLASANAIYEIRRASRELLGDFDPLLARIRPGARVAMLNFESRSTRIHYYPYVYAGSYHRVAAEAIAFYSFTNMAHWPVHYAPGARPPSTFEAFAPCGYRYRRDGAYFDYVLVQGQFEVFPDGVIGPRFRSVASSGRFTLYEKVGQSADADDGVDGGPCAR